MSGAGAPCTCHLLRWQLGRLRGTLGLPGGPDGFIARHHNGSGKLGPRPSTDKLVKSFTSSKLRARRPRTLAAGWPEGVDIMDWRHEAACREVDPELFFPIGNSGPALLQIDEAKQVCRRCSVMDECLRWAIDSGQDAGVWGGMSEDERRAVKRRTIRLRARAHV
jgi:WhiB family redox-sensing transcriptional regulator